MNCRHDPRTVEMYDLSLGKAKFCERCGESLTKEGE